MIDDLRHATRRLRARPGLAGAAVAMLGLAIGLTTAVFTIADALFLTPVPFHDADRLHRLVMFTSHGGPTTVSPAVLDAWRRSPVFQSVEGASTGTAIVETAAGPVVKNSARVSPGMFTLLGARPATGRAFDPAEGRAGADSGVLLADALWRSAFGADPSIVGRSITIDGASAIVAGVMPASFHFPSWDVALWRPLDYAAPPPSLAVERPQAFVRLAAGVPLDDALRAATEAARAADAEIQADMKATSLPLGGRAFDTYWGAAPALAGGVALVFFVLCANVCSLLLANLTARRREVHVCAALGASRSRLFAQAAVEHALLGVAGAALGVFLAWILVSLARVFLPQAFLLRTLHPVDLDPRALVVAAVTGCIATLAAGVFPAWSGTRPDACSSPMGARTSTETRSARLLTRVLLVSEIAFACTLLIGASVLMRSFVNLSTATRGLQADGVLTAWVSLPRAAYPDRQSRIAAGGALRDALRALPGVTKVGLSRGVPPSGGAFLFYDNWIADTPGARPQALQVASYDVGPEFFDLYGIPILQGRIFDADDRDDTAIVGERLAAGLWPGRSPVGHVFRFGNQGFRVVGVARETRLPSLDANRDVPQFYVPYTSGANLITMSVRCDAHCPLDAVVRRQIAAAVPRATVSHMQMASDLYREELARPRAAAALGMTFGLVAVLAAAGGLFSVLMFAVAGRRREFGIRAAVGASPRRIRRLVYRETAQIAGLGVLAGCVAAVWTARALSALLYGVAAFDPASWALVVAILVVTTMLACWRPARLAARVDPVALLRSE